MTTTICKTLTFSASHSLPNVPASHKCRRLHGHNYKVEVRIAVESVDKRTGWVIDFSKLKSLARIVIGALDHTHLNDLLENPTAENVAHWIFHELYEQIEADLKQFNFSIRVWETDTCWAEVSK